MTNTNKVGGGRYDLPQTPYEWAEVGGVRTGDGVLVPVGAIVHEDLAYRGYGQPVRILAASSTVDGRATWVTIQPLDDRDMKPRRGLETRVLYSPGHLWATAKAANEASIRRANGDHRITEWS